MSFGRKGEVLLTGETMGVVRLFATDGANLLVSREAHKDQMHAVAASPVADVYASADDTGVVTLWRGRDLQRIRSWNAGGGRVNGLVFSKDGALLYVGCADGTICRVPLDEARSPLAPLEAPAPFAPHKRGLHSLSLSADGTTLVSCTADGRILWWDTRTGRKSGSGFAIFERRVTEPGELLVAAVSPDGTWVVAAGESGTLRVWQRLGGGPLTELKVSQRKILALAWHPTELRLAWGGANGKAGTVAIGFRVPEQDAEAR